MEISEVVGTLYCTQRIAGLEHCALRVLRNNKGAMLVATDPVGTRSGNWVFTVSGSAGRLAMGNKDILTDLAIGGIIDNWDGDDVSGAESNSSPDATKASAGAGTTSQHQGRQAANTKSKVETASPGSESQPTQEGPVQL